MTQDIILKICDRCGMPEHGSISCDCMRPLFEIQMENYEFEKAQELADEAGWSWPVTYIDYGDLEEDKDGE